MSWLDHDLIASRIVDLSDGTQVENILRVVNGGTGLGAVGANGQVLTVASGAPAWQTPGSGSYTVVTTVVDSDHTVTQTNGVIIVPFSGLTLPRVLNLPSTIAVGTIVIAGTIDNSLTDANDLTWTPASGNISYANVNAATFAQKQSDFPLNSQATFVKLTSTLWMAL